MTKRERVFRVVEMAGRPISTQAIAKKMRTPINRLSSEVSKLHSYGYFVRVRTTVHRASPGNQIVRNFYLTSGKPYEARP